MPYVISGNIYDTRIVVMERTSASDEAFFFPFSKGQDLRPALLALKPDPLFIKAPPRGKMPEIFGDKYSSWIIKEAVKQLIEELEPNVHTFVPVNVRERRTNTGCGQYYLLHIGQAVDAVVIDETDFADGPGRAGFTTSHTLSSLGSTVLDAGLIADRHLWRGGWDDKPTPTPFAYDVFCSDELAARFKLAKIDGWRFRRCKPRKA